MKVYLKKFKVDYNKEIFALFLDKRIGKSSLSKFYKLNFPDYLSFGKRFPLTLGGTLRNYY